jgi:pyruvate dehydrogenase E2 component (dihydrolipoamide acetyltransferase)
MAKLIRVPEVAAGATEALFSEWLVTERQAFRAGDPIAVLETDKAQFEIEAEEDSVLLKTFVTNGVKVWVGAPLALVGSQAEVDADLDALLDSMNLAPSGLAKASGDARPAAAARTPAGPRAAGSAIGPRLFASPLARRMLREAGLAPELVTGTGPGGRILRRDAEGAIAQANGARGAEAAGGPSGAAASTAPNPAPIVDGYSDIPHSRLRRAVARRLTESKQSVPHFYLRRSVRLDALLSLRAELNGFLAERISVNDLVLRAVALTHVEIPAANVIWTEDATRQFTSVDIGVAVATARGLVSPVLRGVERTSLVDISATVRSLVQGADAGTLRQGDLEGGSISVSNLGAYDVDEFAAIINPPHSAILAVGTARPTPAVRNGEVVIETVANLVLSVDHRCIDGAIAARWMAHLVSLLENPLRLLV